MLSEFQDWFAVNESQLKAACISFEIVYPFPDFDIDKYSIYVDIDTDTTIARITIWETGECDLEALEVESAERLFPYQHYILENYQQLDTALKKFFLLLVNSQKR
jgi:hypothetical protein